MWLEFNVRNAEYHSLTMGNGVKNAWRFKKVAVEAVLLT